MQSEAGPTWRLQLDDLDEEESRRKIVILRALLHQLTAQLEELHRAEVDVDGRYTDDRVFEAHETLQALRHELEPLLA